MVAEDPVDEENLPFLPRIVRVRVLGFGSAAGEIEEGVEPI